MFSFDLLIPILGILSGFYAISYGNYEFQNKKIASAMIIYFIALAGIFLSVFQYLA